MTIRVPVLSLELSARWLGLVAAVLSNSARALIGRKHNRCPQAARQEFDRPITFHTGAAVSRPAIHGMMAGSIRPIRKRPNSPR